ncbi:MAG: D-2-hydroxyacid dehydrogenase [Alphaproteobacteria bacterium]
MARLARRTAPAKSQGPYHLYCVESEALGPLYTLTPRLMDQALKRHPKLKGKLRITITHEKEPYRDTLASADFLFGWTFDHKHLKRRAPNLKLVQIFGAGVNHVYPLDWMPDGCLLANSIGVHGPRAGEYLIMALLMLNNRMPEMATLQRAARWGSPYASAMVGKTVLIIGVGTMGAAGAAWAKKFGMTVLGIRRSGKPHRSVDRMYKPKDLHRVLPKADFVIVAAPATDETKHMLGRREFKLMRKGAGLVNFARADLVDYDALRERLIAGDLTAILDVFDPEPLPSSSPLWNTPNLVMSFHCCSDDPATFVPGCLDLLLGNIERVIAGRKPKNWIDPNLQY